METFFVISFDKLGMSSCPNGKCPKKILKKENFSGTNDFAGIHMFT